MGRKSLGELPTVLTTVRIAGEHAAKLTAGGKKLGEAIRELIEREFSAASLILQSESRWRLVAGEVLEAEKDLGLAVAQLDRAPSTGREDSRTHRAHSGVSRTGLGGRQ